MRVGTICFAIERGLGHLAKSFYDAGIVTDPVIISHGTIPMNPSWYPKASIINVRPNQSASVTELIKQVDWMLFFETPFDWEVINACREQGVKTALLTMYECTPERIPVEPDLFICPSLLDKQYFPNRSVVLPIPVDERIKWNQRTQALTFVHNAGYVGLRGRNGTYELLQAMKYVEAPIKLTVRAQTKELLKIIDRVPDIKRDKRVEIKIGTIPYEQVWSQHDVAVQPEKFNGMSLPLQEARASGMLVMTTDRFPVNCWLPKGPLIPIAGTKKARTARRFNEIDECIIHPEDIAQTIDNWYGEDISSYSLDGRAYKEEMTWEHIKPKYMEALEHG